MYPCPHCHRSSIRFASKWRSSVLFPAECPLCGGLSFAPGSPGGVVMVLNTVLLTAAFFATVYWQSGIPVVLGAAIALAQWLWQRHLQPLLTLSPEQMARARKAHGLDLLLAVLFVFWQ